jgi:hypothetical protein
MISGRRRKRDSLPLVYGTLRRCTGSPLYRSPILGGARIAAATTSAREPISIREAARARASFALLIARCTRSDFMSRVAE